MRENWSEVTGLEMRGAHIAEHFGVSPTAALFLASRFEADEPVEAFLHPSKVDWPDPSRLPHMKEAARSVAAFVKAGESILIHGDYDVDGLMGTAVLLGALNFMGAKVSYHVPSRFESGYGLSVKSLEAVKRTGAKLVITTDCGTNALETGNALESLGIALVVTDHHIPQPNEQPPGIIVNPQLEDNHPDQGFCGATVALQLALQVARELDKVLPMKPFLRLASIATIADVAPLTPVNRKICKEGFKALPDTSNTALSLMLRKAGVSDGRGEVRGRHVAYQLAPRINAAGRMGDAGLVLRALFERNPAEAAKLVGRLEVLNKKRKELQATVFEEAKNQATAQVSSSCHVILVFLEGWGRGVIGPVAARLAEFSRRPAFVVALEDGLGTGSARSWGDMDVSAFLAEAYGCLLAFGWHKAAAGFTVGKENLETLAASLNLSASRCEVVPDKPRSYFVIEACKLDEAWEALGRMDPFGPGNEEPVVGVKGLGVRGCRVLKGDHLIWETDSDNRSALNVIAWEGEKKGFTPSALNSSRLAIGRLAPENYRKGRPYYLSLEAIV